MLFPQNYFEKREIHIFFLAKNSASSHYSPLLDIYTDEKIVSSVVNQIAAFAIIHEYVFTK